VEMLDDGCTHDGGSIWRHGGIDGRPGKDNVSIPGLKIGRRKMVVMTSLLRVW
jgi:hypothetical protein